MFYQDTEATESGEYMLYMCMYLGILISNIEMCSRVDTPQLIYFISLIKGCDDPKQSTGFYFVKPPFHLLIDTKQIVCVIILISGCANFCTQACMYVCMCVVFYCQV